MKKKKLLVALLAGVFGFSACNDAAEELFKQESEIKLTSEITQARVTSQNLQSTQIVNGQQVGVFIDGARDPHNNVKWTADSNGNLDTSTPAYWGSGNVTITAYHPYYAAYNGNSYTFSVNTDQSTDDNYVNSDLLWTNKTTTKSPNPVALTFVHKLSKINVTLTSEQVSDLSNATISICGTNTSALFNPLSSDLSNQSNVAEIVAGTTTVSAYTASAIIIPQEMAQGTQFIKVTHNSKVFYYTLPSNKRFEHGCSYSYNLKVASNRLEEVSTTITDWNDETISGDMEEDTDNTDVNANSIVFTNTELSAALYAELGADKVSLNADGHAIMKKEDVLAVTYLDFGDSHERKYTITSLSGIEYFTNLKTLYCNNSGLTECNVKENKALENLVVCWNNFTSLDVSGLSELVYVGCAYNNNLIELKMDNCDKLGHLEAMDTQLTSIDFSNPNAVWQLICGGSEDLEIDLTKFPNLTILGLRSMGLTTLDVPENLKSQLTWLSFENNQISSIDLSEYYNLEMLDCCGNSIEKIDISCLPNLVSLSCSYQKDKTLTLRLTQSQKNQWDTNWINNNSYPVVLEIVDAVAAIVIRNQGLSDALYKLYGDQYSITINADGYAEMLESEVLGIIDLNLDAYQQQYQGIITTLEGIQYFKNLQNLACRNSGLIECDLSQNTKLQTFAVQNTNNLTSLDFSNNPEIYALYLNYNRGLSSLNLTGCNKLMNLQIFDSNLSTLEIPNKIAMDNLLYGGSPLRFNLNEFPNLTGLGCEDMELTSLDFIPDEIKSQLTYFSCENNALQNINLSKFPNLFYFKCGVNNLTTLDLSKIPNVKEVDCYGNKISSLDISMLTKLENLVCSSQSNNITISVTLTQQQKDNWATIGKWSTGPVEFSVKQ